jgi:hypothetical protein
MCGAALATTTRTGMLCGCLSGRPVPYRGEKRPQSGAPEGTVVPRCARRRTGQTARYRRGPPRPRTPLTSMAEAYPCTPAKGRA